MTDDQAEKLAAQAKRVSEMTVEEMAELRHELYVVAKRESGPTPRRVLYMALVELLDDALEQRRTAIGT